MPADFNVTYKIALEDGKNALNVTGEVSKYIQGRGLFAPSQPTMDTPAGPQVFTGQLPPNLTELTDDRLGELLTLFGRWQDFIQTELAYAYNAYKQAESQLEFVEAQLYITYKLDESGKKRTDTERKSLMLVDSRLIEVKRNLNYYDSIYRIIKAMASAADKSWETVSRRITQRQQDLERGRRENNVGNSKLGDVKPYFRR